MFLLSLQGLVDPTKELLKLRSQQKKLEQQLAGLTIRVQGARYQEQVSLKAKSHLQQKVPTVVETVCFLKAQQKIVYRSFKIFILGPKEGDSPSI